MVSKAGMVGGLFLMSVLTIVDRVCVSTAKGDMSRELGLNDREFGWVFAVFSLGYALCQVPSGALADRFGARRFLAVIVALWSVFTGLTGLIQSLGVLLLIRLLFGVAESGAYPGSARAIYVSLETSQRGFAQGVVMAGSRLGAAFGLVAMAWSVQTLGWRQSFFLLAVIGFTWAAGWFAFYRESPALDVPSPLPRAPFQWKALAQANTVFLLAQYFASNFTFYLCLNWLLPYMQDRYQLTTLEAGAYASVPMYAGAVANWLSGVVMDALYRRGHWRISRVAPALGGFVLAAVTLVLAAEMDTARAATVFFALATFGADLALSPSWIVAGDIGGEYTGTVSGSMNMAGNIGALVSSLAFPYLIAWTGTPKTYFYVTACLNVMGAVCWSRIRPERKLINTQ